MNYPKISIVTPNFNGDKYLEETIQSVLSQNYPNLEYIIIDGGSTDNSVTIIKKYENQLKYWISEPDKGLYDAVQKGFDHSTGEIMAWINSDDLYHIKSLFSIAEIFKINEVNWLQGNPSFFDEQGRIVSVGGLKKWSKLDFYLGNYKWIQQESVFWRRTLWEKAGGQMDVKMKYAGDLELWLRFFRHEKLYVTTSLLGGFRLRSEGQLSLDFLEDYIKEAECKIRYELENKLSIEENKLIQEIKHYNCFAGKIRFKLLKRIVIKLFYSRIVKLQKVNFSYSPIIHFDRVTQSFKI